MANISEMINIPTPIVLGDRVRKLKRLEVSEVFGQLEQEIVNEYTSMMQKVASSLVGKDKVDYLVQMSQGMPSGQVLSGLATQKIGTLAGLIKLFRLSLIPEADSEGKPLPEPDLIALINENPDLVRQLSKAMVGIEATAVKQEGGGELPLSLPVQSLA